MKRIDTKILMFVEASYPHDVRVKKEALVLTRAGYSVAVIAIRGKGERRSEVVEGVKVYRIPRFRLFQKTKERNSGFIERFINNITSVIGYAFEYLYFTSAAFVVSFYVFLTRGFDVVHMHNPPDTLSVVGFFYRLMGKKYVFDHHDLSPELYLTRVTGKRDVVYRTLLLFEKLSCKWANIIVSTNESYRKIAIERHSAEPDKIFIVRNNPILNDCTLQENERVSIKRNSSRKKLLFLGSINPQDGVDILLQVLHHLVYVLREENFICNIVGDGDDLPRARHLVSEYRLENFVDFKGLVTDRKKVREYLWMTDIGVEPAPCNFANEHSTFIKVMEFMAAGKPLVAFDLRETKYSADGSALLVPSGDIEGFAKSIKWLLDDPKLREKLGEAGLKRVTDELTWEKAAAILVQAYNSLVSNLKIDQY